MDYEKAYKEALAKAREIHRNEDEKRFDMEWLFPELKDSEDEKIRKRLIDLIYKVYAFTNYITCVEYENIIAWLEKQGSQQPTIIWHSVSEDPEEMKELFCEWESDDATWHDVAFYDEESKTFRHAKMPINVTKWVYVDELLERQGEQKPFDYESANIQQKDFAPKQEWSEEDEKMANDLIEGCLSSEKAYHLVHTSKEIADWIESLKDRIKWKED